VARNSALDSHALLDRLTPDDAVPDWAWQGRDLTEHELWEVSMQRSLVRRQAHANRPKLPQARKAGVTLALAAVAAAATPAKATSKTGAGTASGQVDQLLHVGSRGPAVRALQRQLGIPDDGIFGPQTKRAVRLFQKRHGLVVDGIVGPRTRAELASRGGSSEAGPKIIRAWWVRPVQRKLGVAVDGEFGPQSRAAVRRYQARHGLIVDGIVGPQTLRSLGIKRGGSGHSGGGMRIIRAWWVVPVQRKLGVTVDGEYGPITRRAVRRYQARHGLIVDGIVGPQTLRSLGIQRGGGERHSGGGTRLIRAWWVAPVQRKLGVTVDGVYGPITRRAVKRFQARHGLVVDGIVGPQTLAALGIRHTGSSSGGIGGGAGGGGHASSRAATAVAAARSALGRPYAWGGNGPSSFDCSGLMVWAWRQAGVTLPRTSYAQYLAGRPVSRLSVRAGDLVFFATNGPGASHVGIAISGSSFISATTRGVRIQPIGGSYWGSSYVGARRVA
jgi:peptidoglycan DL-endopeptidase CwlO